MTLCTSTALKAVLAPAQALPTGLPAKGTALGLLKNSDYISVLVEKLPLGCKSSKSVCWGETEAKQLADKFP